MAYGDYDGPDKPDKGKEGGSCNRGRCQCSPARWYNHGSYSWYCDACRTAIEFDPVNYRDWLRRWLPRVGHPMFETREMMDARKSSRQEATDMTAIQKAREARFHIDRMNAWLRELWEAKSLTLHMSDGTTRSDMFGLLQNIRSDVMAISAYLDALDAETEVKVLDEKAVLAACEAYHADLPTHDYPSRWAMEQAIRAYLASATPADVGEEPVAWQWRSKGWSVDAKWSEWLLGRKPPERKFDPHDYEERPLYSATALERVVRDRDEALKGRDDWKDMFEQAKQKHGYCIVRGNELTDKLSAAEAELADARKVIERLRSTAEAYRCFRAPTDLPEDESQQWQQLEHQERAARRFLEETK